VWTLGKEVYDESLNIMLYSVLKWSSLVIR